MDQRFNPFHNRNPAKDNVDQEEMPYNLILIQLNSKFFWQTAFFLLFSKS